jgi:hypothetical protein
MCKTHLIALDALVGNRFPKYGCFFHPVRVTNTRRDHLGREVGEIRTAGGYKEGKCPAKTKHIKNQRRKGGAGNGGNKENSFPL